MNLTDYMQPKTNKRPVNAVKTGEPSKAQSSEQNSSNESATGRLKRKPNANNCILCEIVLPELEEEIARLKNKIKKLNERET